MKKPFTNPTPIEPEQKEIEKLTHDFTKWTMVSKINEIIDKINHE